jgi:hypothetical protein
MIFMRKITDFPISRCQFIFNDYSTRERYTENKVMFQSDRIPGSYHRQELARTNQLLVLRSFEVLTIITNRNELRGFEGELIVVSCIILESVRIK